MASSLIKVVMPGKGSVTLKQTDHLATGGEGAVYRKNNLIFKLFLNPERAQANGMSEKVQLLAQIKHPFIVAPLDVLYDDQHRLIGYYMSVAEGLPLMKTFTNGWRDQNTFGAAESRALVENMREAVKVAHSLNAVIVDGNETNYLVEGVNPRIIDVDSWQIGKHPATAIMPSIKDYHTKGLTELSDWFAWAIVSFQVFTGIHPYKGTHPLFKKGDLEQRMRANASVFDTSVRVSSAVRDFSCIPAHLRDWYEGVFQQGERSVPPSVLVTPAASAMPKKVHVRQTSTGTVTHEKLLGLAGPIKHVSAGGVAFYEVNGVLKAFDILRRQAITELDERAVNLLFSNKAVLLRRDNAFLFVELTADRLQGRIVLADRDPVPQIRLTNSLPLQASKLVVMNNRLFALNTQNDNGLIEIESFLMGGKPVVAVKNAWPVQVQSTRFFDGVASMDCLGVPFLVVPEGDTLCILRAPALKQFKVLSGYARSSHYVWIYGVGRKDGLTYRLEFRAKGAEFELLKSEVVDDADEPLVVTNKGIAVSIPEDGLLVVLNTKGDSARQVHDSSVSQELQLCSLAEGIGYYVGNDLFKLSLA